MLSYIIGEARQAWLLLVLARNGGAVWCHNSKYGPERYGLLQPTKDEAGNRFYCIEDAIHVHTISTVILPVKRFLAQWQVPEPAKLRKLISGVVGNSAVYQPLSQYCVLYGWLSAGDDDARRFEKALPGYCDY